MPNNNAIEETESYLDLLKFHDPFKFPEAEALIPLNPRRWVSYAGSSILTQDLDKKTDNFMGNPIENLKTAKLYLETSTGPKQFAIRFGEVVGDTAVVNLLSEASGLAGVYANKAARKYAKKIEKSAKENPKSDAILKTKKFHLKLY